MGLLDTGSTVSVVHPSVLSRLSQDSEICLNSEIGRLRLADGSATESLGTVQLDLQLGTGKDIWPHMMVVAEIEAPIVIGIDFLRKHQCTLSMKTESLTVGDTTHLCRSVKDMPQVFRIIVAETVVIPAMSEMIVPGKTSVVSHITQGVVEGLDRSLCNDNVAVGHVVLNPARDILPLRLMNLSNEPQTLHKGTRVAECHPVVHVSDVNSDAQSSLGTAQELPLHVRSMTEEFKDRLEADELDMAEYLLSQFTTSFSESKNDLSITHADQHSMEMSSHKRVKEGCRRLPLVKRQALKCELDRLLSLGVIEPSSSSWASPVVLVTKKDGSLRLCVDYRKVNDLTIKDSYPLPRIDDSLDALSCAKWFSTLDLSSGYWQVPMDPKDVDKTAFTTPYGLYHFKVMPFGLANAPATFERMMERVLAGLHWETCLIYLDDVIVFSRTFDEHITRLHQVFSRMKEANLKLSPSKCKLFCHEVEYLGHIVTKDGVATDPRKISAITSWPVPCCVKEVRSFLGLCSYYRRYVSGFATIASPLHRATEANREFHWSAECQEAFDELTKALTTPPILAYPSEDGLFWLDTDASDSGVGAVLSQEQDGEKRVISYYSRVLTRNERNYCVTRRELLAVVMAVKHFHHYLWGRHFVVRSDHGSLRWLMNFKNPEGQLWRWLQTLSEYDYEIQYRPGAQHRNADGLSRRPCHECRHCERQEAKDEVKDIGCPGHTIRAMDFEGGNTSEGWIQPWSNEQLRTWQREDTVLAKVIRWVEDGTKPRFKDVQKESTSLRTFWFHFEQLECIDGIIYRKVTSGSRSFHRLVCPKVIQEQIFDFLHTKRTGGHLGINRTSSSARKRFWWPGMKKDVVRWCKHCERCQRRNLRSGPRRSQLHQEPVCAPMERIAFDILSLPVETTQGNTCILVVCDYFTKWVEAFALSDHKAPTVADVLLTEVFLRFGVPRFIHSDQAPEFMSELMTELYQLLEIQRTRTCPYRPQSDGLVERFNRTLINMLSKFCDERQEDWDQHLPFLLCAYRATVNESTGCSPNLLVRQCYLLTWCIHLRSMTLTDVILTMWRGLRQPLRTILSEHGSNWDWRLRGRNDITMSKRRIRHSNREISYFDFTHQILEINSAFHILVLIVWWPNWVR